MIVGGTPLGVWLCRQLNSRAFSVRLYEADRDRADELAAKLDWVTVVHTDPTDTSNWDEERLDQADAFVSVSDSDEHNILTAARAKSAGTRKGDRGAAATDLFASFDPCGDRQGIQSACRRL